MAVRTGIGYDSHRLVAGRPLIVGGVTLTSDRGLEGHSDADVLAHAVTDAVLGAAGLGDIGEHFPDSDERYRGADSIELLRAAAARVREAGFTLIHVDATLVLEAPKLGAARERMRGRLAEALGLDAAAVNVKATTGEGVGFVGRGEGAAALAIATIDG
jgi:2-C-methyl-D-erythritol 2,4-cyclodiphosphate synthase